MAHIKPIPVPEVALPRTSGGFRLIAEIGRGGMGVVYEAEELSSGRRVALKVLAEELSVSDEAYERFRREARIAAAISDSRCVFVYGAHRVDGSPAIAMELCGGETLEHRLTRKEPIPIETAVRWTLEILEGLEAAHASGIVHRDVKPSNCFTTEDGHVKIGDFGLARSLERDVRLTQSGAFLGSPLYASPEQVRGREVDVRSDLYSCGGTLYALLTGRAPYGGANVGEVLARILSEPPPPPRSIRPEIPRALEKIVLRAMEREPEKRFKDHASLRKALVPFASTNVMPGSLVRRFVAYMIDSGVLSLVDFSMLSVCNSLELSFAELDPARPGVYKSGYVQLLFSLVAALYFVLLEGIFGATFGKWLVGQRVVTAATNQTSVARVLLRTSVFFAFTGAAGYVAPALDLDAIRLSLFTVGGSLVGYALVWISMRKRNGWRGLHDLASGMRVVQLPSPFSRFRSASPPPAATVSSTDTWPATLGGYQVDGVVAATTIGTLLQARDPDLDRTVWIHALDDARNACDDVRRALARPARLRWLDRLEWNGKLFEVFEAPGGTSLIDCLGRRNGLEWPLMLRFLRSSCDEMDVAEHGDRAKLPASLDQLWIDRSWMLRVLDEPIVPSADRTSSPTRAPLELLGDLARRALPSDGRTTPELPPDLPGHAEGCARRILGLDAPYGSVAEVRAELVLLSDRTASLAFATRAGQLALAGMFPVLAAAVIFAVLWMSSQLSGGTIQTSVYVTELLADARGTTEGTNRQPLTEEDRRARMILISSRLANPWEQIVLNNARPDRREVMRNAIASHPQPTAEDVAWAKARVEKGTARDLDPFEDPMRPAVFIVATATSTWSLLAVIFAFAFRGGFSFNLFHVRVRDKRGKPASRLRCAVRALVAALPLAAIYWLPAFYMIGRLPVAAYTAFAVAVLLHAAWLAHALARPTRSIQDLVAGTRLVPR